MADILEGQQGIVDIEQVPKTYQPETVRYFTNIMNKVWDGYVNGKKYHFKQNETKMMTEPIAHCLARQLSNEIIFGEENKKRQEIRETTSEDAYIKACQADTRLPQSRFDALIKQMLSRPPKDKDVHLNEGDNIR